MFGKKNDSPISEGLSQTSPARYLKTKTQNSGFGKGDTLLLEREETENPENKNISATDISGESKKAFSPFIENLKELVLPHLLDRIDPGIASQLSKAELKSEFAPIVSELLNELKVTLNRKELGELEEALFHELLGLGPIENLLSDDSVSDILVNGPHQVYVERKGKLELTDVKFRDNDHVMHIANRICNLVGRRVDQTTPLADARLADGSRVNVIIPPLSLKGPTLSIRKFTEKPIDLNMMVRQKNMSKAMRSFLTIVVQAKLNIVISGGTGSGKTTLLNALSKMIGDRERVVTIEDAAELRLQQPHVVSLETRPPNLEGKGAITIRDLMVNALRMRPDRIILGEVRGSECIDMLQAMNTGHEGSMCTLHANKPREALTRMENMISLAGLNYPISAIRTQTAEAIDLIIQIARMRDGQRRITEITEIVGMEGDVITAQTLFSFVYEKDDDSGMMTGQFVSSRLRPHFLEKISSFGLEKQLLESVS